MYGYFIHGNEILIQTLSTRLLSNYFIGLFYLILTIAREMDYLVQLFVWMRFLMLKRVCSLPKVTFN